jgi:hypothetical protein
MTITVALTLAMSEEEDAFSGFVSISPDGGCRLIWPVFW